MPLDSRRDCRFAVPGRFQAKVCSPAANHGQHLLGFDILSMQNITNLQAEGALTPFRRQLYDFSHRWESGSTTKEVVQGREMAISLTNAS